jgi:hypothetical protein
VPKIKPDHRVIIGRNITLTAAVIYALTRSAYYLIKDPDTVSPAQGVITADGQLLWAWGAAWIIAAVFCVADMVNRHTRHGLSAVIGLAFAWGVAYLLMWIVTGSQGNWDMELLSSAANWITPTGMVWGLVFKVTALQDMLRRKVPPQEVP